MVPKPVYVKWIDSNIGIGGWSNKEEYAKHAEVCDLNCETLGWIIQESKDRITVASSLTNGTNEINGRMIIPKCAILELIPISG